MVASSYKIAEVDINQPEIIRQVNKLLGDVFMESKEALPLNKLMLNTQTDSKHKSLYLAAIENDEIIGFNGFISHDLILNGQLINCYQSCWTATSDQHRGKKIFPNLINAAKNILKENGAAFIFGFPNQNSGPIFLEKLKFNETPFVKSNIYNVPFFGNFFLNKINKDIKQLHQDAILQNDDQLIKLKQQEFGEDIKILTVGKSRIWGKIIKVKKFGININFFSVGGIELSNSLDLENLIKKVFLTFKRLAYIQFAFPISHSYVPLFKRLGPAQTNSLIIYDLNLNTNQENLKFNLMSGIKDVF